MSNTVCREGCVVVKTIYMVCAHTSPISQWTSFCPRSSTSTSTTEMATVCTPVSRAEVRFGWCAGCTAFYAPTDLNNEALIRNYWAFKTAHGILEPLDAPNRIPGTALLESPAHATRKDPRVPVAEVESLAVALAQASSGACTMAQARIQATRFRGEMLKWAAKRQVGRSRSCRGGVDKPLPPTPGSAGPLMAHLAKKHAAADLATQPQHASCPNFETLKPLAYSPPSRSATSTPGFEARMQQQQDSTSVDFCWRHCAIVAQDGICHECDDESMHLQMRGQVKSFPVRDHNMLRIQAAKQIAVSAVQPLCFCDGRGFECTPCTDRRISSKFVGTEQWV
ncbi:hypothetical protein MCOR27_000447 [Pyricularia oryzae]|uniref:Uncharacterized protein n=1 Tax=Pyricularia grisea TaxID=148305 RepID=A0ABQ8NY93_PYRGI|nr:hypothetical protein MCOR01_009669 [Pyricularia oryzae]KAI6303844.1 hypothetical protein MCOR33_001016 [Pyricularia grisea]KAH9437056.1 hypothetical protein MCOR02_000715 [Pyricularia oryzae]KAI6261692.1 hypothetical protein MCOR19_002024 [Pyricularia oryzae]KAI6281302.1 hypothetical protein MCOR26_003315 [Pyricularia oryzae]